MIYKLQNGGIIKLQTAGIIPKLRRSFEVISKKGSKAIKTLTKGTNKVPITMETIPDSHRIFRAPVYKGGSIRDPYFSFFTTDPEYAKQYGPVNKYILEQKGPAAIAKEPMIGSRDIVQNDMFIARNTKDVPSAKIILGHDLVTPDIPIKSKGLEILSFNKPSSLKPTISPQEAATTYHFDGRMPLSRSISEAERLGIPKALRSSPKALEDPYYWGYKQWNDRYNAAVESGNIQEGRRLYDLHEARNAPNTQVRGDHYHGTNNTEYNIMDSTKNPGRTVGAGEKTSNFFSDIDLANTYLIDAQGMGTWYQGPGRLIRARLNIKNPYIFDYEGAKFNGNGGTAKVYNYLTKMFKDFQNGQLKYFPTESDFINSWRAQNKYLGEVVPGRDYTYSTSKVKPEIADLVDNIIDRNVYDGAIIRNINELDSPVTDYVTFTPNQVKLANIITYDDHGNMIPIVKRHNYHNPDMRYKQGGKLK